MAERDQDRTTPRRIGLRTLGSDPTGILQPAGQSGSVLVIVRDEEPAESRSPSGQPHRRPGALRGKIRMTPDVDTLPPDDLAAMEGGEE